MAMMMIYGMFVFELRTCRISSYSKTKAGGM